MKPPQHHRKRGCRKTLASVLRHVEAAQCGYDDASWLYYHVAGLRSRLDRAEGELKGMVDQADNMHRECAFWRDQYQRVAYQLEKETEDG